MQTDQNLVDGQWAGAASGKLLDVMNPATDEVMAKVPDAGAADVDRAVKAARRAFDGGWRDATGPGTGADSPPPGREDAGRAAAPGRDRDTELGQAPRRIGIRL